MTAPWRMTARPISLAVFLLFVSALANASSLTVSPTVTAADGLFHYAYTITNGTPDDSFLIDIPVPASTAAVENLVAPEGFKATFDSGLGLVSFLEDTMTFGSSPESGFSFDSPDAPGAATFDATLLSSSTGMLYTVSSATLAPVPEPPTFLPVGLLAAVLLTFGTYKPSRIPTNKA